jgi:hypothetical protein
MAMKLGDLVERIQIDPKKLTAYALNPQNDRGKHKAHIFRQKLGYTQDNYERLLAQIESQVWEAEAVIQSADTYGQRIRVDLEINGTSGQQAIVRTGWLISPGSSEAQLLTLYVR